MVLTLVMTTAMPLVVGDMDIGEESCNSLILIEDSPKVNPLYIWNDYWDGGEDDRAFGVAVDSNDNIFVTGWSEEDGEKNFMTVKYNSAGSEIWSVSDDGGNYYEDAEAHAVAVDSLDNIIVVGTTRHITSDIKNILAVKYDQSGNELNSMRILGDNHVEAYGVAVDSSDNIIIVGRKFNEYTEDYNYYTCKLNPSLSSLIWSEAFDGGDADWGYGVAVDSEDNIIVTGMSLCDEIDLDIRSIKYNPSGEIIWQRCYDHGDEIDWAYGVTVDSNDNVIITGFTGNEGSGTLDYLTIKYDEDGTYQWKAVYDGGNTDVAHGVACDSEDNIMVTGYSEVGGDYDFYTIAYDEDGNKIGDESTPDGYGFGIAIDSNDDVIVTGYSDYTTDDFFTVKYTHNELNSQAPVSKKISNFNNILNQLIERFTNAFPMLKLVFQ